MALHRLHRWMICLLVILAGLTAAAPPGAAQQSNPVLVHVTIGGEVLSLQLARVGQTVKQGEPLIFIRGTSSGAALPAAVAPVSGQVVQVMVRPGDQVNIGDVVAAIQPQ